MTMRDTAVLVPVFVLAGWTAGVLLLVAVRRLTAGLPPSVYTQGEAPNVPPAVCLPNRNYMNLLELPVLFYVACLFAFVAVPVAPLVVPLAWAYVALRIVHSLIHITYNHVMHRFAAFVLSNGVLVALWGAVGMGVF